MIHSWPEACVFLVIECSKGHHTSGGMLLHDSSYIRHMDFSMLQASHFQCPNMYVQGLSGVFWYSLRCICCCFHLFSCGSGNNNHWRPSHL